MYKIKELTDITNAEFQKLKDNELRDRIKDMNRWIQKRISGFRRYNKGKGISTSPALGKFQQSGSTKLSYSDKLNRSELQREYIRGMTFLKAESGTATGWSKVQWRIVQGIKRETGVKILKRDFDNFWTTYQRFIEQHPYYALPEHKYEAFRRVAHMIYGTGSLNKVFKELGITGKVGDEDSGGVDYSAGDSFVKALTRELDDLYEQTMGEEVDEIGGMFKLSKPASSVGSKKKKTKKSKSKKRGTVVDVGTEDVDVDIEFDDIL